MKINELTPAEARIYNALPVGRENAIKRCELADKLGMTDRGVRKAIEAVTEKQHVVCNLKDGRGYYIPADELEYLEYEKIINSYKCALQRKEYSIRRARELTYGKRESAAAGIKKRRQKALQETTAV